MIHRDRDATIGRVRARLRGMQTGAALPAPWDLDDLDRMAIVRRFEPAVEPVVL